MSGKVTLLILLGAVIATGVLFFRIVWPFFLPLFLATVLAVLFRPIYIRLKQYFFGHHRIAAAVLTMGVLLVILLPLGATLILAGVQLVDAGKELVEVIDLPENVGQLREFLRLDRTPALRDAADFVERQLSTVDAVHFRQASSDALLKMTTTMYDRTSALAADVIAFTVGLAVMFVALYYFFADGDELMTGAQELIPFAEEDQQELMAQFVVISSSDNLVRAHVLHARAHMHPLVALVSVLGALKLIGLWGIFLGPIAAAFFYALLKTFNKKLLCRQNVENCQKENRWSKPLEAADPGFRNHQLARSQPRAWP
jgi:predicted PurR-regulated permease PerM